MPRELTERVTCEKCGHTIETEAGGQVTGHHGEPCVPTPGMTGQGREHERPAAAEPEKPAPSHQTAPVEPSRRR